MQGRGKNKDDVSECDAFFTMIGAGSRFQVPVPLVYLVIPHSWDKNYHECGIFGKGYEVTFALSKKIIFFQIIIFP